MFFGGITQNNAVQLWKDLNAAMPTAKLFGPDGVAESAFSEKIGSKAEKQTYITNPTLDPKLYPPAGQEFFKNYKAKYGADPEPYAIYGYEAMSVALQAIKDAGDKGNDRQAVIDAFYKIKNRESVLGTYSIDENGDTTLSDYGGNRIEGGKLVFDKVIKAQTPADPARDSRRPGLRVPAGATGYSAKGPHGSRIHHRDGVGGPARPQGL